jgi:hypothetical protein
MRIYIGIDQAKSVILNIFLYGVVGHSPAMILRVFFCKVNIFLLLDELPQKFLLCLIIE